jgi:predicted phage baseplate assembly protein
LPTGLENVQATYRSGIGLEGEVGAGTLTLLKTKPYGVKSVINPVAADGADDPEKLEDARQNAPMTVRTLDRIVSRWDYEDFAATFAGIGKAQAVPIWDGTRELIHITVADPTGNPVGADKIALLLAAMDAIRDRLREVIVENFIAKTFSLSARVKMDAAYEWNTLKTALEDKLKKTFCFAQRQFGQAVSAADVLARMHAVDGVTAVDLDELYIDGIGQDHTLSGVLGAGIATYDDDSTVAALADRITPAGLLTVNPDGIAIKEKAR